MLAVNLKGDTLVAVNPAMRMVPASNVKLITTGIALRTLGPSFRFRTSLAYSGEIRDTVLRGNLYVIGGGDPTTGSESECAERLHYTFASWLKMVRNAGIRRIDGLIVADPRFFEDDIRTPSWSLEDAGMKYGAVPRGLNFYENAQLFSVSPGDSKGDRPRIEAVYPDTPWMMYRNCALTTPKRSGSNVIYNTTDLAPVASFSGKVPEDSRTRNLECSNEFGAYTLAYQLYKYLKFYGIEASGYGDVSPQGLVRTDLFFSDLGKAAADTCSLHTIGSTYSYSLSSIVDDTNRFSNNFFAEALLRMTGKFATGSSSRDSALVAERRALKAMGLETRGCCTLRDGSGLSRKDYVSPDFFVKFLCAMARTPVYPSYLNSLPYPGSKSTLKQRLPKAPEQLRERIRIKSGSMNGTRCYGGYVLPSGKDERETIVFSLMTNDSAAPASKAADELDKILAALAAQN